VFSFVLFVSLPDKPIEHIFRHTLHALVWALRLSGLMGGQNVAMDIAFGIV
jgi:hypothetical protein